jgi:hypothetical protein
LPQAHVQEAGLGRSTELRTRGIRHRSSCCRYGRAQVKLQIFSATPNGWRAKATHCARPGLSCVIFVRQVNEPDLPRTDGDGEMAGEERVPLCDRME